MLIALLVILAFALLAGLRAYSLIGRDGAVHSAGPKAAQAIRDRKRLERKLGVDKTRGGNAKAGDSARKLYGIYMSNQPTLTIRRELRLSQPKDLTHA
jgi:hypothetical protein